ncbi:MAG: divalent-cation tolerance protein CutA [bacterium]
MTETFELVEIVTTVATEADAAEIGRTLVQERLVACATFVPCRSVYRWRGAVQEEGEIQLSLKTTAARAADVERRLRELHGYETPAILRVTFSANRDYAAWVADSVDPEGSSGGAR